MARGKNKKKVKKGRAPAGAHAGKAPGVPGEKNADIKGGFDPDTLSTGQARSIIEGLTAGGQFKQAVDLAKKVHAREPGPESEALLADCYFGRVEEFLEKDMTREALGLIDLIEERFPERRDRLQPLRLSAWARSGDLEPLAAPLLDPELSEADRTAIEDVIRREVVDPGALADCAALPLDHPLRRGAAEVWHAFEAVCGGPVEDDEISLPGISRRSPLSPWKMMVRAIACFYRHDDPACRKCLESVAPDSAPARLIPVIQGLMQARPDQDVPVSARKLQEKIGGCSDALFQLLGEVDRSLDDFSERRALKAISKAVTECRRTDSDLVEGLKQHISVRTFFEEFIETQVDAAMGGPPLKDASYWRIMAVLSPIKYFPLWSLACWEEFRLHARHEKLFAPDSIEEGLLYANMATLCARVEKDRDFQFQAGGVKQEFLDPSHFYSRQPPHIKEAVTDEKRDPDRFYFLEPDKLFSRACAIGPGEDVFVLWMIHARKKGGDRASDMVAEEWHRFDPENVRPLLHLAESAERRKAYQKALKYVETAEALDEFNPAVRRARFRLMTAKAKRHISQRKPHLLDKDIAVLQSSPLVREGDRQVLLRALNWAGCLLRSDTEGENRWYDEVAGLLKHKVAAHMLEDGLARAGGLKKTRRKLPELGRKPDDGSLVDGVSRVCQVAAEADIDCPLPLPVRNRLVSALTRKGMNGTAVQFRVLAETAIERAYWELAYAAAGAGLARGGHGEAGFLFLRGLSLRHYHPERGEKCLAAARELARQQGDNALFDQAAEELLPQLGFDMSSPDDKIEISSEDIATVIRLEKELVDPKKRQAGFIRYASMFPERPKDSRGFSYSSYDEFDDEDDSWEVDDEDPSAEEALEEEVKAEMLDFISEPSTQLELFGNPAQALLDVMLDISEKYPDAVVPPGLDEIAGDYPELAEALAMAIAGYIQEYGEEPDPEEVFRRALDPGNKKKTGRKAGKKRKRR
ncbi:MAG: hypothetical protein KKB20_04655, partial [Proteobacteria bacterium]|nr:hypothetical protein [Pseudomonadota bacterium]